MTALSALRIGVAVFALSTIAPPAIAQFVPPPTPTADALAAQMRRLGADPRDVYALIAAGELSTKLGDPAAALGFFGRAQAIEPANLRIVAGKAGALVLLERPGEALQLYAQAERGGVSMTPYLAQRGLAYDLVGQPGYAQRDYRRALLTAPDDETMRRLALSLGMSGRRDEAMALLDPLLRRSDRAAWRARACILAVAGDVAGAQKIAASMMAGGAALSPFFSRLQALSPADRAFAVHFGDVGASVVRANDARLAPALAALPVEPQAPPSPVAVVASSARAADRRDNRGSDRRQTRRRPGREAIVTAAASPTPTPPPSEPLQPQTSVAMRIPSPISSGGAPEPRGPAASPLVLVPTPASSAPTSRPPTGMAVAEPPRSTATPPLGEKPALEIVTLPPPRRVQAVAVSPPRPEPVTVAIPAPTPPPSATTAAATPAPTTSSEPVVATPVVAPPTPAAPRPLTPAAEGRTPEVARRNTAVLAAIIDTIAVPSSELDVAPLPRAAPRKAAESRSNIVPAKKGDAKAEATKSETRKPDPKKLGSRTPEVKTPDPEKTDPARWWVQVAGGANAADLGRDWKRLTAKSPAAFRGRAAWTAPLRATNRLLAGPFKSQGEATAFVNTLSKDGASAFAWQSEAGQKIERLGAK